MRAAAKRLLGFLGASALLLPAAPASADATFTFNVVTQCAIYFGTGSGQLFGCDPNGWTTPSLPQGAAFEMRMRVFYTYTDDGRSLGTPTFLQTSSSGDGQWVTYEAAALFGQGGGPFVSANDVPDNTSGILTFYALAFNSALEPRRVTLSIPPPQVAVLSAVPEPSTYALMIAPLALIGWAARRQRGRQGARRAA